MTKDQIIKIRADFPILSKLMRNKPFIYLDSGASSLKPSQVIQTVQGYYEGYGVNIHRGVYEFSERATREYHDVRVKTARFIGAIEPDEDYSTGSGHIIFTKGTTEAANLLAYSWGRTQLRAGDEILTTEIEHHSTLVPWHPVVQQTGAILRFVPITPDGQINIQAFTQMLSPKTKVVVLTAMSNVTGYTPPIEELIKLAHGVGAITILDGAQFVSHRPVNVRALDVDFLYFSAHKMLGPTGVGVLYGKTQLLEKIPPFQYGGDMILQVHKDSSTYHPLPEKFEAGTPNIAGVLGFGAALDYLIQVGMNNVQAHEADLIKYTMSRAQDYPWLKVYGPNDPQCRGGIFSFNIEGIHSHDVGALLDAQGIAVRTGFHCAQPYMEQLGIPGTVRASYYLYNTRDEVDALFTGIEKARELFL